MLTRIVIEEHNEYTGCQHSAPVLNGRTQFFSVSQYTSDVIVPLFNEFHHQHSFPVPENGCYQLSGRQCSFKRFRLIW
jgi:hypothetical protein